MQPSRGLKTISVSIELLINDYCAMHIVTVNVSASCLCVCDGDQKKQVELGDRLDLSSYLLKPVQRMTKYALLLQQMLKQCRDTDVEYADLMVQITVPVNVHAAH